MKLTRIAGTVVIWSIALSILIGWSALAQTAQQEAPEAARNRAAVSSYRESTKSSWINFKKHGRLQKTDFQPRGRSPDLSIYGGPIHGQDPCDY